MAERYLAEGNDYATHHDLDSWRFYMMAWRGLFHLHGCQWDMAERDCLTVLGHPGTAPVTRIVALTALGRVRTLRGESDALAPLDEALALATPTREIQRLGPARVARAEAAWYARDPERMAFEAGVALRLADGSGDNWLYSEAAYWLWRAGRAPASSDNLTEPFALEISGEPEAGARAWEARGCPYYAARALLASGQEDRLREALATFDRLGAHPAAALALQRLRETGARRPPGGFDVLHC